ncbi:MAG: hypothetical protein K1Y36_26600 [Blastocatellia bacterium]|nr:hypothetical protein [Blastocatellia bacterium]
MANGKWPITNEKWTTARSSLVALAGLGALIWLTLAKAQGFDFLDYDSTTYLFQDHAIRFCEWERVSYIFHTYFFINYNPLQRLSYMLDFAVWGGSAEGFRSTNYLLHWGAAFGAWLFFRDLTRSQTTAWIVALWFAIHPTRVESVVWLAERKDVLAAFFGFAALWTYLRVQGSGFRVQGEDAHVQSLENPQSSVLSPQSWILWYALCLGLYICALASKAQWVPLVAVFGLCDLFQRRKMGRVELGRLVPFALVSALFAWYAVDAQLVATGRGALARPTLGAWVAGPLGDMVFYLKNIVWPVGLSPRYLRTVPGAGTLAVGGLLVTLALWRIGKNWRSDRTWIFGLGWFVLFLSPMLNLVPGFLPPADRYLYVSLIGPVLPLASWLSRQKPAVSWGCGILSGVVFIGLSWSYLPVWQDNLHFWEYCFQRQPQDGFARASYAKALIENRQYQEASQCYQAGLGEKERFAELFEAGSQLARKTGGDPAQPFLLALETARFKGALLARLGQVYLEDRRWTEAETVLTEAFSNQYGVDTRIELARLCAETKQPEKGLPLVVSYLNGNPYHPQGWTLLGRFKEEQGNRLWEQGQKKESATRWDEAWSCYELGARFDPQDPWSRLGLVRLAFRKGSVAEAETWLQPVINSQTVGGRLPAEAYQLWARLREAKGDLAGAKIVLTEAQRAETPSRETLSATAPR